MFIDVYPSLSVLCAICHYCVSLNLNLDGYKIIQGPLGSKGAIICPLSIWHHASGQILSFTIGHVFQLHSLDFGLGGQ